jgi:cytidylate kinase
MIPVIAIDGPTASGKGTVAHRLAAELGWHYLDSGALYRVTALAALRQGVALSDAVSLARLASNLELRFEGARIFMAGEEVSDAIRTESVGEAASQIAVLPDLRAALLSLQRDFQRAPGLVADGRDMGTVVFPQAPLKVFLTASAAERARRRYKQLIEKGFSANFESLLSDLVKRDQRDATRSAAPLAAAKGAHRLDSSSLSIDQTVAGILALWRACRPG